MKIVIAFLAGLGLATAALNDSCTTKSQRKAWYASPDHVFIEEPTNTD